MSNCPCECHGMGRSSARCTGEYADGGCGHLHRSAPLPDLRALSGLGTAPATRPPDPVPRQDPMSAVEKSPERPTGACVIHVPPKPGYAWRRADDNYLTCSPCYDLLHRWLSTIGMDSEGRPDNIAALYARLDPRPGNGGHGRRAPGFGPRSPANDHVIAMGDPRTVQIEDLDPCSAKAILRQWVLWVWDERYDDEALNRADYRARRHELPTDVPGAAAWLDQQLDWLTRRDIITEFHSELRELRRQLRSATGRGGQRPVGHCIEILANGECKTPIFMPRGAAPRAPDEPITTLPELVCPVCDSKYTGRRLILLRIAEEKAAAGAGAATA